MDDALKAAWERERQVAEARERADRALADCDEMLDRLRQRQAEGPASSWQPPQPAPVRPPEPTQRQMTRDWNAEQAWVEKVIDQRLRSTPTAAQVRKGLRDEIDALGAEIATDINGLEGRLAALAETVAALARQVGELQERLNQAEARAAGGPRLVETSDAAD